MLQIPENPQTMTGHSLSPICLFVHQILSKKPETGVSLGLRAECSVQGDVWAMAFPLRAISLHEECESPGAVPAPKPRIPSAPKSHLGVKDSMK